MLIKGAQLPDHSARALFLRSRAFSIAFLFALLAGGGGAEGPLQNGLVGAAGAVLLLSLAADQIGGHHPLPKGTRFPALVALSLLLVPLAQLIPLPPSIWHNLPGREYAVQALREIGAAEAWRPLSLEPEATKLAAAALFFPLALFLHCLRCTHDENRFNLTIFASAAAISGAIGAIQLAAGHPDWLSFYDGPTIGAASGIFANPNHQSLMMVAAIVACAMLIRTAPRHPGLPRSRPQLHSIVPWVAIFFFAVMALASGSRAGVLLIALGLPGALLIALGSGSLLRWAAALLGALVALTAVILLYPGTNSLAVRESFRIGADARYSYLPDILFTLEQYWPAGSGLGTFAGVFSANENLDFAQRGYLNHAHNDFLELLIDAGALGGAWLGLAIATLLYGAYRTYRNDQRDFGLAAGGVLILLLVGAHSLADYPLRTATLASLTALASGLVLSGSNNAPQPLSDRRRRVAPILIALLIAVPVAAEALRLFTVQWAVREGRFGIAGQLGPSNADALVNQAETALDSRRPVDAERLAALSIQARPANSAALRVLAMSREAQHQPANSAWRLASSFGWRDAPTQLWAFRQALVDGEPDVAALRADALLRTSNPPPEFMQLVRETASDKDIAVSLAGRLRANAPWRRRFFTLPREPSQKEVAGLIGVLRELAASNDGLTRADGRSLISYLISKKAYEQAIGADRLVAGDRASGGNLIDDGGFARLADEYASNSTAFDWVLRKGEHTVGSVDTTPPSYLNAETDGERAEPAADRYAFLPVGAYNLSYRARSDQPDSFLVRLTCLGRPGTVAVDPTPQSPDFAVRIVDFSIDAGCPLVRLAIESVPNGKITSAAYDDFKIVRR